MWSACGHGNRFSPVEWGKITQLLSCRLSNNLYFDFVQEENQGGSEGQERVIYRGSHYKYDSSAPVSKPGGPSRKFTGATGSTKKKKCREPSKPNSIKEQEASSRKQTSLYQLDSTHCPEKKVVLKGHRNRNIQRLQVPIKDAN